MLPPPPPPFQLGGTVTRLFKYSPGPEYTEMLVSCLGVQQDKDGKQVIIIPIITEISY